MKTKSVTPKGIWRMTFTDTFGNKEVTPWNNNQIQDSWATLASRFFGKSSVESVFGFKYLAIGSGDPSWDVTPPTKDPGQNTLENEVARIALNQNTDISYVESDLETVSVVPTRYLKVTTTIPFDVGLGDLREFGIVAGDATSTLETGTLFNWISHSVISRSLLVPITIGIDVVITFLISEEVTVL